STSTVRFPDSAACAARWVATVVFPTPPLEHATSTVFIARSGLADRAARVHRARTGGRGVGGPARSGSAIVAAPDGTPADERTAGPGGADPRRYRPHRHRDPGR